MRRGLAPAGALLILALALVPGALAAGSAKAPPVAGPTLEGKRIALADLRGKPVLINVWSSW